MCCGTVCEALSVALGAGVTCSGLECCDLRVFGHLSTVTTVTISEAFCRGAAASTPQP